MDYSNFTRATYSPPTTLPNHQATYITHTQHSMYHAHTFTHNTTHTILEQQTTALPNHSYHQQPTQHYSISSPSPNPYFPPQTYQQQPQPSYSSFPTPSPLPNSYPLNATPSSTSFPRYYQQQPQTLNPSLPPSRLEMKLSIFDGSEDAYWWIICSEKSFNSRNRRVSDAERFMECSFAMKGSALTWWLSWYLANPNRSWDSFTCALLWHFKPEWKPILPIEGEEEEPTENEKVPEQLEEESAFIASVQEQTEEPKKLVDGGDLQIIQKEDKEKEQDSETHRDFLSTSLSLKPPLKPPPPPPFRKSLLLLPPPEPPDLKSPSKIVSAPPPVLRPPSKPPYPPPGMVIAQSLHSTPPPQDPPDLKSVSDEVLAPLTPPPSKPSDKVLLLFTPSSEPPPPPKPPDLISPSDTVFDLPQTLRPPKKPPDRNLPTTPPSQFDSIRLQKHRSQIFQSQLDKVLWKSGNKSWPFSEMTIRIMLSPPTMNCHMSNCLFPTTTQARDVLVLYRISIFHAPAVVLLLDFKFKYTHSHVTPLTCLDFHPFYKSNYK
ncbi:hypothetical protein QL285_020653 [Trifolium repens]|nr:hypothetical protein QL285_020653 [Trifolium repens]